MDVYFAEGLLVRVEWDLGLGIPAPRGCTVVALQTDNVRKRYGSRAVVDNVRIAVESGEVVGLLGPNEPVKRLAVWSAGDAR